MCESRICAGATEKLLGWEKSHANTTAWSYDMEGHAKKCVKRSCEFANKTVESNCTRSLHHVLMAIISKKNNRRWLDNCQKSALKLS